MEITPPNIAIVLVGARNPLNIGAAARAMSNFGFRDLRLVNEYTPPLEGARSAVNAEELLHAARSFATVGEAVADCELVYATTAVGERNLSQPVDLLRDAPSYIAGPKMAGPKTSAAQKTAILFGSEKHGLTNESLSHCHRILTIPMHEHGTSMNLGQSVAVILYELVRAAAAPPLVSTDPARATAEQVAIFDGLLRETLEASEYMQRFPGNTDAQRLRELTRRLHLPAQDIPVWLGFFRQFLWKMRKGAE